MLTGQCFLEYLWSCKTIIHNPALDHFCHWRDFSCPFPTHPQPGLLAATNLLSFSIDWSFLDISGYSMWPFMSVFFPWAYFWRFIMLAVCSFLLLTSIAQNGYTSLCLTIHQLIQGVRLIFTGGHISFVVAFKGPNVIPTP